MSSLRHFFSPAKLNLFLKILKKRSDGFHELVTLYQAIDFGDRLSLKNSFEDSLSCNIRELESPNNLVWKSLEIFRQKTHIVQPVKWFLQKQIPIGAGLGGGSSNAATALYALNQYFQTGLSLETLQILSEEIGSDVPFFFSSGTALGSSLGEKLFPYNKLLPEVSYVLYFSSPGVLTKDAYLHLQSSDFSENKDLCDFLWKGNDLEKPVFRLRPDLLEKKKCLQKLWNPFQGKVLMSGSGATLFVHYPKKLEQDFQTRKKILALIRQSQGLSVRSLNKQDLWYKEDPLVASMRS
ncbi:4-(cytidine 5'-diphospho)-2-C-methyl-D-erythritol kinase [Chlamydia sp. 17-3921]|uniref:4-(cytidine 5'-diphospho)-2-C-methyl-D-erythritol kinase n=1 Tax=Chlamydia sp. 17-3921 TaxID=2675798 RepID=UPI001918BF5F|nr:4-(cytidine 5'-diphospho)-2-C-methyl-D-erythritol kinase [Chlamydia sp. 17-3921]